MKIVILTETFGKNMSYLGSMLPKYLVRGGADVHVLTLELSPYYYMKDYQDTYSKFNRQTDLIDCPVEVYDGYTIHTLPHKKLFGYVYMKGELKKLRELSPDIVYSLTAIGWLPLIAALARPIIGYKLFTGSHTTASTFPMAHKKIPIWNKERLKCFFMRFIPGRIVSLASEKCYGPTKDCAEIAWRFFGVQRRKVEVLHLGVDTDYFFPVNSSILLNERMRLRSELGFCKDEIVCVYSGKMTEVKNAVILAKAIDRLRSEGYPYRGLFIGDGVQKEEIARHDSCVVLDFMPYQSLARYYRAADIGVWPTNESTSTLDAAACGLPLVVSDGIVYREHVEGNGLVCKMNNLEDLVNTLHAYLDPKTRKQLGDAGALKMARHFSWESVAKRRLGDFGVALNSRKHIDSVRDQTRG
ncbi:MAG: glycosyltransferase family 4 protein [Desulfuromonadales bacterium]|nr:glycosyltransferase family 4 protein [Desulfuromonadales bacterium]